MDGLDNRVAMTFERNVHSYGTKVPRKVSWIPRPIRWPSVDEDPCDGVFINVPSCRLLFELSIYTLYICVVFGCVVHLFRCFASILLLLSAAWTSVVACLKSQLDHPAPTSQLDQGSGPCFSPDPASLLQLQGELDGDRHIPQFGCVRPNPLCTRNVDAKSRNPQLLSRKDGRSGKSALPPGNVCPLSNHLVHPKQAYLPSFPSNCGWSASFYQGGSHPNFQCKQERAGLHTCTGPDDPTSNDLWKQRLSSRRIAWAGPLTLQTHLLGWRPKAFARQTHIQSNTRPSQKFGRHPALVSPRVTRTTSEHRLTSSPKQKRYKLSAQLLSFSPLDGCSGFCAR